MKTSLILSSLAVMAAIAPATLFAQTLPVAQAVPVPVVAAAATVSNIPTTVPDPKALADVRSVTKPVSDKAVTKKRSAAKRSTSKAAVAKRTTARKTSTTRVSSASSSSTSDLHTAQSVLASLKGTYRYLDGVTVSIGKTPGGYQAVSYYTKGRILISPTHRATISRILRHEIWHIIDWRDNGKIDWRESVPPRNAADYLK